MHAYSCTVKEITDTLTRADVKPSAQRIAVLRYLMEHRVHPTVDEIFRALQPENPTLSRTTVYNTLRLLSGASVIKCIETGTDGARWDYAQHDHAHFLCTSCGRVTDIDYAACKPSLPMPPEGYRIQSADIIYRGVCPECGAKSD